MMKIESFNQIYFVPAAITIFQTFYHWQNLTKTMVSHTRNKQTKTFLSTNFLINLFKCDLEEADFVSWNLIPKKKEKYDEKIILRKKKI